MLFSSAATVYSAYLWISSSMSEVYAFTRHHLHTHNIRLLAGHGRRCTNKTPYQTTEGYTECQLCDTAALVAKDNTVCCTIGTACTMRWWIFPCMMRHMQYRERQQHQCMSQQSKAAMHHSLLKVDQCKPLRKVIQLLPRLRGSKSI